MHALMYTNLLFQRWVWAFRATSGIMVNTNNGLERQNGIFKYKYLEQRKDQSISGMVSFLVMEYLTTMERRV